MKKILISIIFAILLIVAFPTSISGEEVTEEYEIKINAGTNSITVEERFVIKGSSEVNYETIVLWIPDDSEEITVLFNNNEPTSHEINGNEYTYNISALNIKMNSSMDVTLSYKFSKSIEKFKKTLIRDTNLLSVTFNDEDNAIFYGKYLNSGNYLEIQLYTPAETPLSWTVVLLIMLLIVFLSVIALYSFKKQKTSKFKNTGVESEELLTTKKALLMSLLKDIEKQHRSKQISDDTYHKLKEQYKQQAVDAMKKLDDSNSK